MEEVPLNKPEIDTKASSAPDIEEIGGLLLRYELPQPEPASKIPIVVAEQNPKIFISREKLRNKVSRYKEQRAARPKEEEPEHNHVVDLPEAHFDRRREAIDQETKATRMAEGMVAIGEVLKESPASFSNPVSGVATDQSGVPDSASPAPKAHLSFSYKKALTFGVAVGIITGLILIFVYG